MTGGIEREIRENALIPTGAGVLIMVSGGSDSVALACVLNGLAPKHDWRLELFHVNYGLRGVESDEDERLCRELAAEMDLPIHVKSPDRPLNDSLEAWCREIRYRLAEETRRSRSLDRIAVAHTKNDQAETTMIHLIRGCGPAGLAGMPFRRDRIIRPFLKCDRVELRDILRSNGLTWREDSMNRDQRFLRAAIREELMPLLERKYNPRIERHLVELARLAAEEAEYLDIITKKRFNEIFESSEGYLSADREVLRGEHPALRNRLIRSAFQVVSGKVLQSKHVVDAQRLLETGRTGARIDLPAGYVARIEYASFQIGPADVLVPSTPDFVVSLVPGAPAYAGDFEIVLQRENPPALQSAPVPDGGEGDLVVRCRRPGDRVYGRKLKLKDWFINRKIPVRVRAKTPLLAIGSEILWVIGLDKPWTRDIPASKWHVAARTQASGR